MPTTLTPRVALDPILREALFFTGNARITVQGKPDAEGNRSHYTFAMGAPKDANNQSPLFVRVLTGADVFSFLGTVFQAPGNEGLPKLGIWRHGAKSSVSPDAPSAKAAAWLFGPARGLLHEDLIVLAARPCSAPGCRIELTNPESIARGMGPVCAKKHGLI